MSMPPAMMPTTIAMMMPPVAALVIADSSFNGYAALAELEEEDWGDLHDIQEIAAQHGEKWEMAEGKIEVPEKGLE